MDHLIRLEWALRHLVRLDRAIEAFVSGDPPPYTATVQHYPQNDSYVARLRVTREAPTQDWSLSAGDIIHNMRSALDNLAYSLALAHSGTPSEEQARALQFPICDSEGEFEKRYRNIARLSSAAQAGVAALQPYISKPQGFRHPLSVLRDLSNIDKHRRITMIYGAVDPSVQLVNPDLGPEAIELTSLRTLPFDGMVVASWAYAFPAPANVETRMTAKLTILFGEGPAVNAGVVESLRTVHDHIKQEVLPRMEAHLSG